MNSTPSSLVSMRRACPSIARGLEARTLTRSIPRKIGCQSMGSPFSASKFLVSARDEPLEAERLKVSTLLTGFEFLEGLVFFRYFSRTLSLFSEETVPEERATRGAPSESVSDRLRTRGRGSDAADSRAVAGASQMTSPSEDAFARKGSLAWLLVFAFALGFGTTVAEPALIAVAAEAARAAAEAGVVAPDEGARAAYADGLRYTVAVAVGVALVIGVFRILKGWPIHYLIIAGYLLVVIMTALAPPEIVGVAYDSGGVTTSTVTVPLVAALGVGLASVIRGRNPLIDGFGLIAFASLTPIIFVLAYGMVV